MELTLEQKNRLRLLSDGELYREAVEFIRNSDISKVKHAQVKGLESYAVASEGISGILSFARHQQNKGQAYAEFYQALTKKLEELQGRVKDKYGFVPEGLTKKDKKEYTESYGLLVAREFLHHLAAEYLYIESVGIEETGLRGVSERHDEYIS